MRRTHINGDKIVIILNIILLLQWFTIIFGIMSKCYVISVMNDEQKESEDVYQKFGSMLNYWLHVTLIIAVIPIRMNGLGWLGQACVSTFRLYLMSKLET